MQLCLSVNLNECRDKQYYLSRYIYIYQDNNIIYLHLSFAIIVENLVILNISDQKTNQKINKQKPLKMAESEQSESSQIPQNATFSESKRAKAIRIFTKLGYLHELHQPLFNEELVLKKMFSYLENEKLFNGIQLKLVGCSERNLSGSQEGRKCFFKDHSLGPPRAT